MVISHCLGDFAVITEILSVWIEFHAIEVFG